MTNCKSCGQAMTEAAAAASIFRLSFLPMHGQILNRSETTKHAEKVGPLCRDYIESIKDLAAIEDDAIVPNKPINPKANLESHG